MNPPLAIDLYCGLGGWAEGFLSEGYRVIGFDIERHDYGTGGYPGQLVLQDVTTLHGSQFKDAAAIVASPPCQEYSYMSMPWRRAKEKVRWYEYSEFERKKLTALFDCCFRIQREAIRATGCGCPDCDTGWPEGRLCRTCGGIGAVNVRHIPLIVENVRGAQKWVGRSKCSLGAFHLWGDIPALMPIERFVKQGGDWWDSECRKVSNARFGSKSIQRKQSSAEQAKIPFPLAQHIARTFKPQSSVVPSQSQEEASA